jgi:predicted SAM-dependent methyltransferase
MVQKNLHLGCGERFLPGFIHIDCREFPHLDYVSDISKLDMLEEESIDLVYASHVLEHFHRDDIKRVLSEWYRVLKIGGVLRIAVPDFDSLVKVYRIYDDIDLIIGSLYGRQDYKENYHYIVFNFDSLKKALESVGFKDIKRYDWRETIHKDFDDYSQAYIPHMDKEYGYLVSLNIEAIK